VNQPGLFGFMGTWRATDRIHSPFLSVSYTCPPPPFLPAGERESNEILTYSSFDFPNSLMYPHRSLSGSGKIHAKGILSTPSPYCTGNVRITTGKLRRKCHEGKKSVLDFVDRVVIPGLFGETGLLRHPLCAGSMTVLPLSRSDVILLGSSLFRVGK